MNIQLLLVQLLVLAFTGVLWWIARRDLAWRSLPTAPAATEELEQICTTLEALVTELAHRLERLERRVVQIAAKETKDQVASLPTSSATIASPVLSWTSPLEERVMEERVVNGVLDPPPSVWEPSMTQVLPVTQVPHVPQEPHLSQEPQEARYAPVYALLAEGVSDPAEIVRRTGLGRGEVDLILGLRARRAL